jgi:CBS domain-containing protein
MSVGKDTKPRRWQRASGGARPKDMSNGVQPEEVTMRVSEAMTPDVYVADPNETIQEAARMMAGLDAGILL